MGLHLPPDRFLNLDIICCLGLLNRVPETGWLMISEIYCFTFLEARHPKSRCWQGSAPTQVCRRECTPSLWWWPSILGVLWLLTVEFQSLLLSSHDILLVSLHRLLSEHVCVLISPLYKDISHIGLGPTLILYWLNL